MFSCCLHQKYGSAVQNSSRWIHSLSECFTHPIFPRTRISNNPSFRPLSLAFLIFISYVVYFPQKTSLFIRCAAAWMIGPDIKTVIIVQIPKLPPSKTPITTITTSNIIRTILTGHPFSPPEKMSLPHKNHVQDLLMHRFRFLPQRE